MSEPSRLTRPPVNGHTDVHDVADITEEIVEVLVRHLKGHVADEQGIGGRVGHVVALRAARLGVFLRLVELAYEIATLEILGIKVLDCRLGILNVLVIDVCETRARSQLKLYRGYVVKLTLCSVPCCHR